jgi:hypothetical protein
MERRIIDIWNKNNYFLTQFFKKMCSHLRVKYAKSGIVTSKVLSEKNDTKNCVGLGWGIVKEELMGEVRIPKLYL